MKKHVELEQSQTRLAVLMATYNGEPYIGMQLDSLFHQTCQDFTLYIHDDGSIDETLGVIETYRQQYPERICVLEYPSQGNARDNFLSLLQRVQADYYMFCDQDDYWLAEKIQVSMERMQALEEAQPHIPCLVFSDLSVTDSQLQIRFASYLEYTHKNPTDLSLQALLRENVAAGCTILCNRALAECGLQYQDSTHLFMHDWWFMLVAAATGRIAWINKPLVLYRQHGSNTVGAGKGRIAWLRSKVKNIAEGRQIASSKEGIIIQRTMAAELSAILQQKEQEKGSTLVCAAEEQLLLQELSQIASRSKWQRICFYKKHRLLQRSWKNRWKLLLV